jgi:hypothetical protein
VRSPELSVVRATVGRNRDGTVPLSRGAHVDSRLWPCPPCGAIREFVQPPCADGHTDHGGECPEWACVDCGHAVVIGDAAVVAGVLRLQRAA